MCSTDPGAYGSPEKGTQAPRAPLLQALSEKTNGQLARSDQVAAPGHEVKPELGPLAGVFAAGQGYIDYNL